MFAKWNEQYQLLMIRTRFLSQAVAFWLSLLAILELSSLCSAIYRNYAEIGSELFWHSVEIGLFLILFFFAFGFRFVLLFLRSVHRYRAVQLLWFLCSILFIAYLFRFDHSIWIRDSSSFGIYDITQIDPFIAQGPIFIFFGILRSMITAVVAFRRIK